MRKIASSLMILILIILFASTFYCSIKTEELYKTQVEQLNRDYKGLVQVELREYQRGFLLSKVQVAVQFGEEKSLPLFQQIRHFPWGVTIYTGLLEGSLQAEQVVKHIPLGDLQLLTDVDWTGASQTSFSLPQLKLTDGSKQMVIQGLEFKCRLDAQLNSGNASFQLASLQVQDEQQKLLQVSGVDLLSHFSEAQGVPLGEGEFSLQQLRFAAKEQPPFALDDLQYRATSSLEGDKLASELELSLAAMELLNEKFTAAELQLKLSELDVAAMITFKDSITQMQTDQLDLDIDPLILQFQMIGLYSQLLRDGVKLNLKRLSIESDRGQLTGQGELYLQQLDLAATDLGAQTWNGEMLMDVDQPIFATFYRLGNRLQQKGVVPNSGVLNEQAEQLAGAFIQKGLLTRRSEGGYRVQFKIDAGNAQLNGQPFKF